MVGVNRTEESVKASFRDLFASAAALGWRLRAVSRHKGKRNDSFEWDRAAKRALAAFAREQPPRRRALAIALLRSATRARRLLGIGSTSRRRSTVPRRVLSRARSTRVHRTRSRETCSRAGPEPPGDSELPGDSPDSVGSAALARGGAS